MPRYLIQFAQFHDEFRVPELESLAKLEGVDIKYREDEYDDEVGTCISGIRRW